MLSIQPTTRDRIQFNQYSQHQIATPASHYSYEELTDIYNQTRVDYIVPMPMNARRMKDYVTNYDINLDASVVSFYDNEVCGVAMLGLRDDRAWITRLGVIPGGRGRKNGSFLMDALLQQARVYHANLVQLEVIGGNEPAHKMFSKFGFEETRELLIIRRPPGPPQSEKPLPGATITPLDEAGILTCLAKRPPGDSWVEETPSLENTGQLHGYSLDLADGEHGWIVFHASAFQMAHFVVDATPGAYDDIVLALLHHVHSEHAGKDTKIENVPVKHPSWSLFQRAGYVESFRRVEMLLTW